MARIDTSIRFWLSYIEANGGVWEPSTDSLLTLLPTAVQEAHGLGEEMSVTADPDVAREDGATLLAPGHPLLTQAAETVLAAGDVGAVWLDRPAAPYDVAKLVEAAREQFPVDHGRIDAAGSVTMAMRQMVRVGGLVTFEISADEHYQEQVECWVDVESRLRLTDSVTARLDQLARRPVDDRDGDRDGEVPDSVTLTNALRAADEQLDAEAHARRTGLSRHARDAYRSEVTRTTSYYSDVVAGLQRRIESASADRVAALTARVESTHAERDRRLAEIEEKHRSRHYIRPFRLHLVHVPVVRLPVDVRRGERRFPLTLEWLHPIGEFAGLRCPHCECAAPLVASKTRLGCTMCLVSRTPTPSQPPAPQQAQPPTDNQHRDTDTTTPAPKPSPRPAKKAAPTAAAQPPAPPSPERIRRAGDKLVKSLWNMVAAGDRRLLRSYAASSPAETLHELYGAAGPYYVLGITDATLESFSSSAIEPAAADPTRFRIAGVVQATSGATFEYSVWWRFHDGSPLVDELTPFPFAQWPYVPATTFFSRTAPPPVEPRIKLDPVGLVLWNRALPVQQFPLVLRMLTAWKRVPDGDDLCTEHDPSVVAAAIDRLVSYRSGQAGATYAAVAKRYRIDQAETRAVNTKLQRRLKLSATCVW